MGVSPATISERGALRRALVGRVVEVGGFPGGLVDGEGVIGIPVGLFRCGLVGRLPIGSLIRGRLTHGVVRVR